MITIKFLGGAKKAFSKESTTFDLNSISLQNLIKLLEQNKPEKTPQLDFNNILIAINGIDSSALEGKLTIIKNGDVVSLIPVIHGGSLHYVDFKIVNNNIRLFEISSKLANGKEILDTLRKDFPKILIQGVSSNYILNKSHAKKIILQTLHAKEKNILLSKKIETDTLLRFACTTQITQAIKMAGVKEKTDFLIIAIGKKTDLNKLYITLKPLLTQKLFSKNNSKFLKKQFCISDKVLKKVLSKSPLEDMLAEKAAILFG